MPFIHLTTFIAAPPERVFDLSRHVSLHKQSMARNREEIIAGVRSGLMNKGDSVTWQAKHLFKKRILQVELTEMRRPEYFADEQVKGDFLSCQASTRPLAWVMCELLLPCLIPRSM